MGRRTNQRGMGMFNLFYILISLAIFGYIGLKLWPAYLESFKIQRAVTAVAQEPGAATLPPRKLVDNMIKRLDVDGVTRIRKGNWQDTLEFSKRAKKLTITARYNAEVPLFYNIAVVAKFNQQATTP